MKWRNLKYVLPNLFTVSSIFCGFWAISHSDSSSTPGDFYNAALAIFFAMFFDGFDGRVARLTRTQSDFGVQLDSLADVISFGAAPALLIYRWGLIQLGLGGLVLAFLFATCAALRLARFNVLAMRAHSGSSRYFTGLPAPLAAGTLVSVVIALHRSGPPDFRTCGAVAILVALLALLMVSNVPYRTFKDLRPSPKALGVFLLVLAVGVAVAVVVHPSLVLVSYFSVYLLMGLVARGVAMVRSAPTSSEARESEKEIEEPEGEDYL